MSIQQKTVQRLCALGTNDEFVSVKMNHEIKHFLALRAEDKGLTLSEECYVRLCESVDNGVSEPKAMNPDWSDFIFNKKIAIDEKKLRRKQCP